jgi:FAD:protein FMN transferase
MASSGMTIHITAFLSDISTKDRSMKKIVLLACLLMLVCSGCRKKPYILSGQTMGTTYHITVFSDQNPESKGIPALIEERLAEVNRSMSLFDVQSELSRLNRAESGEPVCVSEDFIRVFQTGKTLYHLTGGAWDGSISPLVNLWGFGPGPKGEHIPTDNDIQTVLDHTGYDRVVLENDSCLVKDDKRLALDFGSIAKGYAVDVVSDLLKANGFENTLVEIGGEVRASGSKNEKPWVVGINTPSPDAEANQVLLAIELRDRVIATSGDYRNFRKEGKKSYTHVIDPKTGRPVDNHVASVSVLSESTTFADGLATALMVMGADKGLDLVNRLDGVECLYILRSDTGVFSREPSSGWPDEPVK